jgi:hypothetical protein
MQASRAQAVQLDNPPSAVVRHAEIADLAGAHEVGQRVHRLLERCAVVLLVQVIDVDVVGGEPAQAALDGSHHPFARQAAAVRPLAHLVG